MYHQSQQILWSIFRGTTQVIQRLPADLSQLTLHVWSSDQPTDYIPTQYLCELAKSLSLDDVLYSSSLDPGRKNVVLFDTATAVCVTNPVTYQITSLRAEWETVE